ncbi:MAG: Thiamine biosynthesis protein ThiF [Thermodesulfobacteriota bacterium]|nr:Thiamine biosynthesis protein ThiF [Thermodesulfobacteriota bacterium]
MEGIRKCLLARAEKGLIHLSVQTWAAQTFGLPFSAIEGAILEMGLLPARYQRNQQSLSCRQQLSLFRGQVAVIGCGGLGGYIVEELARLGVGNITVVDPDTFDEHNLNRQLFSKLANLGQPKVTVAADRIKEINPAVTIEPVRNTFSGKNGRELIEQVKVVADALDSIPRRLELAEVCDKCGIPLVHGSVGGWYGQVTTQFPGEYTLQKIYSRYNHERGIEKYLGNLSFVVPMIASIEVAEIVKILLGEGSTLRGKVLSLNLLDMEFTEIAF